MGSFLIIYWGNRWRSEVEVIFWVVGSSFWRENGKVEVWRLGKICVLFEFLS